MKVLKEADKSFDTKKGKYTKCNCRESLAESKTTKENFSEITALADDCGKNTFKVSARDIRFTFENEEDKTKFVNKLLSSNIPHNELPFGVISINKSDALDESKSFKESFPRNIDLDQVVMQVANLVDDKALGDDWIEVFPTRDASPSAAGEYFIPLEITGPDDVTKKATFRTRNGRVEVAFLNGSEAMCDSAESIARFIAGEFGLNLDESKSIKESTINSIIPITYLKYVVSNVLDWDRSYTPRIITPENVAKACHKYDNNYSVEEYKRSLIDSNILDNYKLSDNIEEIDADRYSYKNYIIEYDEEYDCYDVYDGDFLEQEGYRTIDDAKEYIDSLHEKFDMSKSIKESINSDIVSMIKKQFPKATIKTFVRKHSDVHRSNPDTPVGKSKYVDIRITPDEASSVNAILQYCNHNIKKVLDSDNRFDYFGDIPARNPRGSKEVILSYQDYSSLSDDEYNSILGESVTFSTTDPVAYAVKLLYQMDKFVTDVYDSQGWLMNGVPDGEFQETTAEEAMKNYAEHDWLITDFEGNFSTEDFKDFLATFKSCTRSKSYNQAERARIIAKAEHLLKEYSDKIDEDADEDHAYSKEEVIAQLKQELPNLGDSGTIKYGYRSEAEAAVDFLEEIYAMVKLDKVGSWFQINYAELFED